MQHLLIYILSVNIVSAVRFDRILKDDQCSLQH